MRDTRQEIRADKKSKDVVDISFQTNKNTYIGGLDMVMMMMMMTTTTTRANNLPDGQRFQETMQKRTGRLSFMVVVEGGAKIALTTSNMAHFFTNNG